MFLRCITTKAFGNPASGVQLLRPKAMTRSRCPEHSHVIGDYARGTAKVMAIGTLPPWSSCESHLPGSSSHIFSPLQFQHLDKIHKIQISFAQQVVLGDFLNYVCISVSATLLSSLSRCISPFGSEVLPFGFRNLKVTK